MFVLPAVLLMAFSAAGLEARFVSLLERDELPAAVAAAIPEADFAATDLHELRDAIEKHDCTDVRHSSSSVESATGDAVTLRIELDAAGITSGGLKEPATLPQIWFVTFQRDGDRWLLKSARTHEARLVDRIAAAPDDGARWEALRGETFDLPRLASAVNFRFDRMRALWPFALELSQATGDPSLVANSYGRAAIVFRCEPERAMQYAERAMSLAYAADDDETLARMLLASGMARWLAGDVPGAIREFEYSAALADRTRDVRPPLQSVHMLVHLELGRGDVGAAASWAQRNAELSRRFGWTEGELNAANNMERIHAYLGNRGESAASSRQVLRIATAIGRREAIGGALYNLAVAEEAEGNYEEAAALLQRAGVKFYGGEGRVPEKLGDLLVHRGRYDEAEAQYRGALERARKGKDGMAEIAILTSLSRIATRRSDYERALSLAREALAATAGNPPIRQVAAAAPWRARAAEGAALAGLKENEQAIASYELALSEIEAEKRLVSGEATPAFLHARVEPFIAIVQLHAARGETAAALSGSERMKARVLRDLLDRGRVDPWSALAPEEQARYEELNERVIERNRSLRAAGDRATAELRDALDAARAEQRAFEVRMQLAHPELRSTTAPPSAADVTALLESGRLVPSRDAAILDYVIGERATTLFVLTRNAGGTTDVRMLSLPVTRTELARAARKLVAQVENRDLTYSAAAEDLWRRLLAPAAALLEGKTRLCIVPDGALWQLPFAVLRAPDGKHLLERAAISYAPSLAYLDRYGAADRWLPARPRVLALGNPAVGGESLSRARAFTRAALGDLPEAEEEAREIGRLYGTAEVLLEHAATEEAVKARAAEPDILHFAAHGISQTAQPLYSSLVLGTRSEREDGLLEAREIARMDLRAQLAVLSACETARGGVAEGEGVIGLSWAFLVAGCPRAIVTHWRADSAAAAEAMVRFHRRIARTEGGGSVATALRDAQLALLRTPRYSHPYYWGGFAVVGASW